MPNAALAQLLACFPNAHAQRHLPACPLNAVGKMVTVEPVPNVASGTLREELLAVLYQQQQLGQDAAKAGGAEVVEAAAVMLQLVLKARYTLRPFLRQGNEGTGGRWVGQGLFLLCTVKLRGGAGYEVSSAAGAEGPIHAEALLAPGQRGHRRQVGGIDFVSLLLIG